MAKQKNGARKPTKASRADKYEMYQTSVQCPDVEVSFFNRVYKKVYKRKPRILREDFCGTGAVSCAWVASKPGREAYGVDLDPEPLAWGADHNVVRLKPKAQERVHLLEGDVRNTPTPPADVLAAQNFSFFTFKERPAVVEYFRHARDNLAEQGVFVLDMFGGSDVLKEDETDVRSYKGFTYVWDQHRFDPITHHCTFYIHFRFKDGSEIKRAFTYDWRLWSIPEVCEMLTEAGFSRADVYWEGTDPKSGEGNGVYRRRTQAPSDPAWVSYVVAIK